MDSPIRQRATQKLAISRMEIFVNKHKLDLLVDINKFAVKKATLIKAFENIH